MKTQTDLQIKYQIHASLIYLNKLKEVIKKLSGEIGRHNSPTGSLLYKAFGYYAGDVEISDRVEHLSWSEAQAKGKDTKQFLDSLNTTLDEHYKKLSKNLKQADDALKANHQTNTTIQKLISDLPKIKKEFEKDQSFFTSPDNDQSRFEQLKKYTQEKLAQYLKKLPDKPVKSFWSFKSDQTIKKGIAINLKEKLNGSFNEILVDGKINQDKVAAFLEEIDNYIKENKAAHGKEFPGFRGKGDLAVILEDLKQGLQELQPAPSQKVESTSDHKLESTKNKPR